MTLTNMYQKASRLGSTKALYQGIYCSPSFRLIDGDSLRCLVHPTPRHDNGRKEDGQACFQEQVLFIVKCFSDWVFIRDLGAVVLIL